MLNFKSYNILFNLIILTFFALASYSGLIMSTAVPVIYILLISMIFISANNYEYESFINIIKNSYLENITLIYMLIAALFGINFLNSAKTLLIAYFIITITKYIFRNMGLIQSNFTKFHVKKLGFDLTIFDIAYLLLFTCIAIEIASYGYTTRLFRSLINTNAQEYHLFNLDRSCALLVIFSWGFFRKLYLNQKFIWLIIKYIMMNLVLYNSDSLASHVAYNLGILMFLLAENISLLRSKIFNIVTLSMLTSAMLIAPFFIKNTTEFVENATYLPLTAKHRIFIWKYVSDKASEHSLLGIGAGNSKFYSVDDADHVNYANMLLSPLPMHPHNAILQLYFETGLIGIFLICAMLSKYIINYIRYHNIVTHNNYVRSVYISSMIALSTSLFTISLISYNLWQSWWFLSICFSFIMLNLSKKSIDFNRV